jgi:hypothetical protein
VVNATFRALYPRERHGTHCVGGWVGPRATLGTCKKNLVPTPPPPPDSIPDCPARSKSLYRLSYPGPHILTERPEYFTRAFIINQQVFVTEMRCVFYRKLFLFSSVFSSYSFWPYSYQNSFDIMNRLQSCNTGLNDTRSVVARPSPTQQTNKQTNKNVDTHLLASGTV